MHGELTLNDVATVRHILRLRLVGTLAASKVVRSGHHVLAGRIARRLQGGGSCSWRRVDYLVDERCLVFDCFILQRSNNLLSDVGWLGVSLFHSLLVQDLIVRFA